MDTYANLQKSVVEYLDRAGLVRDGITRQLPSLIAMAEGVLNFGVLTPEYQVPPLRVRDMETLSSLTPTSGVVTLPDTFLEPRRVVEKASIRRPLEYMAPATVEYYYPTRQSGLANHYTIIGSSLYTFPLSTNDIEVHHYRTVPALSNSNTTNWLLTKSPQVYLQATLLQAALFLNEDAAKHGLMLKALVGGLNAADARANVVDGGVYLTGPTP